MKYIKNKILRVIAGLSGISWAISSCMIDTPSWIPSIACVMSAVLFGISAYASGMIDEAIEESEEEFCEKQRK